jgi:hypothetical protein
MERRFFSIFLLSFIVGFLILPKISLAEVNFSNNEVKIILGSINQQPLSWERQNIIASSIYGGSARQGALIVLRGAVMTDEFNYAFTDIPKNILKELIIKGASLLMLPGGDQLVPALLTKIEQESVKVALEIIKEWLSQNEIRVASGILNKYKYTSYSGNKQSTVFGYSIAYHPVAEKGGDFLIEIYSPGYIEPPNSNGSSLIYGTYWEIEDWLKAGNTRLDPFVVRIKGRVSGDEKSGYLWDQSSFSVEVNFNEPIPEFNFKEPSFLDKLESYLENTRTTLDIGIGGLTDFAGKIIQIIRDITGTTLGKINSIFSDFGLFRATVGEDLLPRENSGLDFSQIDINSLISRTEEAVSEGEKINKITEELGGISTQDSGVQNAKTTLEEMQETIDDIAERIDVLSRQISELTGSPQQDQGDEEGEEDEDEEIEHKEVADDGNQHTETIVNTGGGGTVVVNYCEKTAVVQPARNKVIINEVAWMGTIASSNDEWIELKNITGEPINLSGWQLLDKDRQVKIVFGNTSSISANGFNLLERTDDTSVPGVSADYIYTGILNDTNEALYLFDNNCQLQDEVKADPDWAGGNKSDKKTIERGLDLSWHTYNGDGVNGIFGTPRLENSQPVVPVSNFQIVFDVQPFQNSLSFIVPFQISVATSNEGAASSNLAGFVFRWKEEDEEWQEEQYQEIDGAPDFYNGEKIFIGDGEKTYYFQIKAKNLAGEESNWLPDPAIATTISLIETSVVINEIQLGDNEFVELYNSTDQDINVSSWYFSYYSTTLNQDGNPKYDWNNPYRNKPFSESVKTIIPAKGYYLIGFKGYPESGGSPSADWQPYSSSQLGDNNGSVVIFPWNPEEKTPEEAEQGKIDAVGWGDAYIKEGNAISSVPSLGKSLIRKQGVQPGSCQDTDNNETDFEIGDSTPTNSIPLPVFDGSSWPMYKGNPQRNGQSTYSGPSSTPSIWWIYAEESDPDNSAYNHLYTSPIIDSSGNIYSSATFPAAKQGVISLSSSGVKNWFDGISVGRPLAPKEGGGVKEDNSVYEAVSLDGTIYKGIGNMLFATDASGMEKWHRTFDFIMPEEEPCAPGIPSVTPPVVGGDGMIYVVVAGTTCNTFGDGEDYLYVISSGNDIVWEVNLGGYNSTPPVVSSQGMVYIVNLFYGKYAWGPSGYLKAVSGGEIKWTVRLWSEISPIFVSTLLTDSGGNVYLAVDKTVFAFDADGNELWNLYLDGTPRDWNVTEVGLALSSDGVLYLSGRGAIVAIR